MSHRIVLELGMEALGLLMISPVAAAFARSMNRRAQTQARGSLRDGHELRPALAFVTAVARQRVRSDAGGR